MVFGDWYYTREQIYILEVAMAYLFLSDLLGVYVAISVNAVTGVHLWLSLPWLVWRRLVGCCGRRPIGSLLRKREEHAG